MPLGRPHQQNRHASVKLLESPTSRTGIIHWAIVHEQARPQPNGESNWQDSDDQKRRIRVVPYSRCGSWQHWCILMRVCPMLRTASRETPIGRVSCPFETGIIPWRTSVQSPSPHSYTPLSVGPTEDHLALMPFKTSPSYAAAEARI
jgi:hypothetical protein